MDFQLTAEQEMLRKTVQEFAAREVAPTAAQRDEDEQFSRDIYQKIAKLGLTGVPFPEEYGGAGWDNLSYIIAVEELSRACASTGITFSASISLAAWPISAFGNAEQKKEFLTPLAGGSKLGAFGLTESGAGTDAAAQQTIATADGGNYILNGVKTFITNGGEAEIYVIMAMTDRSKGTRGISAFIVEKDTPGFTFGATERKMGIRASATRELIFRDCRIPKENLLGREGDGFKIAMATLDGGRIGVAAQALGIAQRALDEAVKYAKERRQFGKPISSFQGISFMLADMSTQVEAARLLTYRAAYQKDQGRSYSKEAAMAKMFASDAAMQITTNAVQVFGGYGYSREYPVERLMRDAKITQIYEGTNQVQQMVISGALLR